ncbi:MAG: FAD-dependent monooxygenase [Acetobacteraceae bacterium]|nr:FAD-dependent monooxygenase [Acetobacteraceae bacterium]MBV8591738.1 FAD-dependent monooxygenase [Acetobacteraceae bacterium]
MKETVVIGGGPAGAAAAILLARAGRDVTVLERNSGPAHKVCGDFLSAAALQRLAQLGIDPMELRPARINAVRLIHGNKAAARPLPFPGIGLSRRALDEALLHEAARSGADVVRGHTVRAVSTGGSLIDVDGGPLAGSVLLSTGKHDVRGARRAAGRGPFIGFKTYLALSRAQAEALRGYVEIVLYGGGYAGLQLTEANAATLCLLIRPDQVAPMASWEGLLDWLRAACPHLAIRLAGSQAMLPRPLAVYGMPYGWVNRPVPSDHPRLFRLGDQAGVIPSFTGQGVTIALFTAKLAAQAILSGWDAWNYHRALRAEVGALIRRTNRLHRLLSCAAAQRVLALGCQFCPAVLGLAEAWTRSTGMRRHYSSSTELAHPWT